MDNSETHAYDDIINLPHHVSEHHPHMPMESRAAQFSPFAALSGFAASIAETERKAQEAVLSAEREPVIPDDPYPDDYYDI